MKTLKLSFDKSDTSGRGSVFMYQGDKTSTYLRALVENASAANAGLARLFLTKIEFIPASAKGKPVVVTADTLKLNWALTSGADVEFYSGYRHFADIITWQEGDKAFTPMVAGKAPAYWAMDLAQKGSCKLSLLLAGPNINPIRASLKFSWPMKDTSICEFKIEK